MCLRQKFGSLNLATPTNHHLMKKKRTKLDAYEQEIEDNFEKMKPLRNQAKFKKEAMAAAKSYVEAKKSVTIRIANSDIMAIKEKASKLGVPYQTYINILIHREAIRP